MSLIDIYLLEPGGSGERGREGVPVKREKRAGGKEKYILTRAPFGGTDITAEAVSSGTTVIIKFSRNEVNRSKLFIGDKPIFEDTSFGIREFAEGIWSRESMNRELLFARGRSHSLSVKSINGNKEFNIIISRKEASKIQ